MCTNCGCNSCNECNECPGQYSSNCKPILDVNCLPTLGRTSRHYLYRTPDSKLWYANANCTAWLELTRDEATETNKLNVLLDLTNRVIEVEKALKAKKDEKPSDKEDKPTDKDNTLPEAIESLKKELKDKASVTGLEEVNKAVQKLSDALNAKEDKDTIYDDSEVKKAINDLKATVAKLETKEDKDTVFDPTAIETRLTALESKEDNDKQTLSIEGKVITISNGNSITLPEETDILRQINRFKVASIEKEWTLDNFGGKEVIPFKDGVSFPYGEADFVSWNFYLCGLEKNFGDEGSLYASNSPFYQGSINQLDTIVGSSPILQQDGVYIEKNRVEQGITDFLRDYTNATTEEDKKSLNKKLKLTMRLIKIVDYQGDN